MSLNSDDNYPAVNESDNIEACDDEVEDESSENDFFWVLLKNGFDDKPTMMRRFALLGIFNFYDLSTTSEERLQEVGFAKVHARKLQALARRNSSSGSGSTMKISSKSGVSSSSAAGSSNLSSGRIGTSLDRPTDAASFLGAEIQSWKINTTEAPMTSITARLEAISPSADASTHTSAAVLMEQSRELGRQNKLGEAAALCERAVNIMTQDEGAEMRPDTMQGIAMLAEFCRMRGRLPEAALHAAWLLQLKKQTMGEEDLSTADTMFLLGQIYKRQGHVDEAAVNLRWALKIRESMLGENHPKTALSLHALGNCFFRQAAKQQPEKLHDARASYIRALKIRRHHHGVEHFEVSILLNNVAVVLYHQHRVEEALEAMVKALEIKIRTVGYDNASVADSLFNIGCIARDLYQSCRDDITGKYNEISLDYFSKSAVLSEKALGSDHPHSVYAKQEVHACASLRSKYMQHHDSDSGSRERHATAEYRDAPRITSRRDGMNKVRRRPETGRSSWDMEQPNMCDVDLEEENIMALVTDDVDLNGRNLDDTPDKRQIRAPGEDFRNNFSSSQLTIPSVEQIVRAACNRPYKGKCYVPYLYIQGKNGAFYHSAELLFDQQGKLCCVLAGDDSFDNGFIL